MLFCVPGRTAEDGVITKEKKRKKKRFAQGKIFGEINSGKGREATLFGLG